MVMRNLYIIIRKSDIAKYIKDYDINEVPAKLEHLIKMFGNILRRKMKR